MHETRVIRGSQKLVISIIQRQTILCRGKKLRIGLHLMGIMFLKYRNEATFTLLNRNLDHIQQHENLWSTHGSSNTITYKFLVTSVTLPNPLRNPMFLSCSTGPRGFLPGIQWTRLVAIFQEGFRCFQGNSYFRWWTLFHEIERRRITSL